MKVSWIVVLRTGCAALFMLAARCSVAVEQRAWTPIASMAAAEAHQAVAADGQYVYAVNSTHVARYDRTTGQRIGLSQGAAIHLNSAFLDQGLVYCAHSNHPQAPDLSQIVVLDPANMQLSTFKDFGAYGGSLTWAVRKEGHWWCNFARYGKENCETFLVQFDADWNERGRWTYPMEVIRRLGQRSVSGGIWDGDTLLVTGHDDPVLFRLRVPQKEKLLELVTTEPAPFAGQGIAVDPQTGGLVGIDRGQRQVVFAAAPQAQAESSPRQLRVLTYNIHHGEGLDGKLDLERIAKVISAAEPDLVALQEVDREVGRTGRVDQPAELARLTNLRVAFGGNLALQGGDYGNAILSRLPILRQTNHRLPGVAGVEPRGVLEAAIQTPQADEPLLFYCTHFDHQSDEIRLKSAQAVCELVANVADRAAILAGDLNATPNSAVLKQLGLDWRVANADVLFTSPASKPRRQIDFVLYRPGETWQVIETKALDESVASDHRPLLAVFERR